MMKKNGFTLAEVLITLAIIGVVATLTLPALMTNTGEQQAISGFKKGINTLTEAAQMNSALEGFDYGGLVSTDKKKTDDDGSPVQSLYGLLANRASIDMNRSGKASDKGWKSYQGGSAATGTDNYVIYFRDGACLSFPNSASSDATASAIQSDGLPYGIKAIYDYNGNKNPNVLSNCQGNVKGVSTDTLGNSKLEDKCSKEKRVIKDQFGVRLRGSYAVPNGAAAQWAAAQ